MKSKLVSQNNFLGSAGRRLAALTKSAGRIVLAGVTATFMMTAAASANPKYAGIVVDARTGKVLYGEDADQLRFPASLTKMMTLYLTFEALENGRITKSTPVRFSANAAKEPPSKLGVGTGRAITVEQAILALVTRSANDAATALGELLGGSEDRFAKLMTQKARALGMTRTVYRNANGLPNTAQVTTARDQARLGMALRQHFPQYYDYFSTRSFKFGKQVIGNHNRLLGNVRGVDGIKTGYTRASGFNLVTSAQLDGRSIVAVVMGGTSGGSRDAQMRRLVAAYMPKASRRGGGAEIEQPAMAAVEVNQAPTRVASRAVAETVETAAAVQAANPALAGMDLPESGPVPTVRYNGETSTATREVAFAAAPRTTSRNPVVISANTLDAQNAALVAGEANPAGVDAQVTNSVPATAKQTARVEEPRDLPSGWVIQIGATAEKAQAEALLSKAQDKGGKALSVAKPFTVAFADGGSTVYRARFGGFGSQDKAQIACKSLKRAGFACWAAQQ
ncbi:SPOR domain-containing protein [Rhizobium sp. RU20A]|uniref:SPOR domain-containing protein n=1 Tax=Rhizobium sp. RU20A TaxID=1907412 RepID=UPI00122D25E5|nr:SPOR domain-containing protein [Rhizobium sp. RU20A]